MTVELIGGPLDGMIKILPHDITKLVITDGAPTGFALLYELDPKNERKIKFTFSGHRVMNSD